MPSYPSSYADSVCYKILRVAHNRLIRVCHVDYDRDIALVALDTSSSTSKIVAVGRLTKEHGLNVAEFSMLVADDYQGVLKNKMIPFNFLPIFPCFGWICSLTDMICSFSS